MTATIRRGTASDAELLSKIIRESYRDVTERFNITPENCPGFPSFNKREDVLATMQKDFVYYVLEEDKTPCGCIALEQKDKQLCKINRLTVLPNYRNRGYGEMLVKHTMEEAKKLAATEMELSMIGLDTELRQWYESKFGFKFKNTIQYPHRFFEVLYLTVNL
ncbi:MAG: GNAT family N-acetyltransferase [Planctomycetes bacterium]|nr:GNAT family N-acetyltransferase [Planctomycetota bacterium]